MMRPWITSIIFLEMPALDCIMAEPLRIAPMSRAVKMMAKGLLWAIRATGMPLKP